MARLIANDRRLLLESPKAATIAYRLFESLPMMPRFTVEQVKHRLATTYGNYVFADSTVVIHHPATKRYMDENFEDDRSFMLGRMGKGKGIERVQSRSADITVSDMISVDLGSRTVEMRHFGFAQTPGDLVIWAPDAKVLWVGNMIQAPSPALPWLLEGRHRDTIETLTRVRDFFPDDATIIPGHGRPIRPADIDFPIRYLRELDTAVSAAIEEGRSV